jgi:hypothetical protein
MSLANFQQTHVGLSSDTPSSPRLAYSLQSTRSHRFTLANAVKDTRFGGGCINLTLHATHPVHPEPVEGFILRPREPEQRPSLQAVGECGRDANLEKGARCIRQSTAICVRACFRKILQRDFLTCRSSRSTSSDSSKEP